jgi:hypothetical protein
MQSFRVAYYKCQQLNGERGDGKDVCTPVYLHIRAYFIFDKVYMVDHLLRLKLHTYYILI